MRNIDGIQIVGTEHEVFMYIGYNRDFIIVDDKIDSIYINPTFDVFLLLAKNYGDEFEFLKCCYTGILCQTPFPVDDYNIQWTKLHIALKPPIDWSRVDDYVKRSMSHILENESLDEFALEIHTALLHVCRDYPKELIDNYAVKMKGAQYV